MPSYSLLFTVFSSRESLADISSSSWSLFICRIKGSDRRRSTDSAETTGFVLVSKCRPAGSVRKHRASTTISTTAAAVSQRAGFLSFRMLLIRCFTPTSPKATGHTAAG